MSGPGFNVDRRDLLALGAAAASLLPTGLASPARAASLAVNVPATGRDQPFDNDWLFHRREGAGFEAIGLDDSAWRTVDLPHDWSVEDVPGSDPMATRSLRKPVTETFRGTALAILRAKGAGAVRISVEGEGLAPANTALTLA